jgi:hypothetical protein
VAVVLDAPVLIGVAMSDSASVKAFGDALAEGKCYMTIASAEEFACVVTEHCGAQLAEKWIGWLYSVDNIEIVEASQPEYTSEGFVSRVAEAYSLNRISVPAASAAALSNYLRIPVLTYRPSLSALEREGFCQVRWGVG